MTCIVAYRENGVVYMGGDSAGVGGSYIRTRTDAKVFKNGEMLFGFQGSFRVGQILRYNLVIPDHPKGMPQDVYMNTLFIATVIDTLQEYNQAAAEMNSPRGEIFLVGYRGQIYYIEHDYQIGTVAEPYDAIGSGQDYALGALYTCDKAWHPIGRIKQALKAAAHFSTGVRAPFKILSIGNTKGDK